VYWGVTSVEDLRSTVERAWHAGGRVVMPVTAVGELGYIALVEDTEGNAVSLHAPRA
jgi:predicted enzyme related to lactoylglutathione lyase